MTAIELAFFVGLPTCVAFCFLFPFRESIKWALAIGFASAMVSALSLFLVGGIWRLFKKRWPEWSAGLGWAPITFGLVAVCGFFAIHKSRFALLGLPAAFGAIVGFVGPRSWRKLGFACFAAAFLISIVLRVFGPSTAEFILVR